MTEHGATRRRTAAIIVAALIAGLCFGPVFGVTALLLPVGAVCLAMYLVTELCRFRTGLLAWRPILTLLAGLLAVTETVLRATTLIGLPTGTTIRALSNGLTSWQATLESTWPARPDPDLVLFVPLLVLVACLLGVELLDRTPPLVAILPALAVVGVSQLYIALTGAAAVWVALAFAAAVAALLVPDLARRPTARRSTVLTPIVAAAILTVLAIVGAVVVAAFDPLGRNPYTLQQVQSAVAPTTRATSPLAELAGRLDPRNSGKEVFRYQSAAAVSRWRQVALDEFDGVNWTTSHPLLRLGTSLRPVPEPVVNTSVEQATVRITGLDGPWLPGQLMPRSLTDVVEPQVEPVGSTLVANARPDQYQLSWTRPRVSASYLLRAGVDPDVPLGDLGAMPAKVTELAHTALGDRRATFQTAIALEGMMRRTYKTAVKPPLPSGHGWPQLTRFLVDRRPGTSEQFAAGYVALARANGIPARLVVGFRAPEKPEADGWYVVRNGDAMAWPEVAVDGVGWWPLDPFEQAVAGKAAAPGSDSEVTDQARAAVPPMDQIEDPEVPPAQPDPDKSGDGIGFRLPIATVFLMTAAVFALWVGGVPLLKALRAFRRRRRPGSAGVVGAWWEARDRLRAHGLAVSSGMTVRDLLHASGELGNRQTQTGLTTVARSVDEALWSGTPAGPAVAHQAWEGVREVRRGLRSRPLTDRLYAALELRTLFRSLSSGR